MPGATFDSCTSRAGCARILAPLVQRLAGHHWHGYEFRAHYTPARPHAAYLFSSRLYAADSAWVYLDGLPPQRLIRIPTCARITRPQIPIITSVPPPLMFSGA